MTDLIYAAIEAISPTYKPNATQRKWINEGERPHEVAATLALQVTEKRAALVKECAQFGIHPDDVTDDITLGIADFKHPHTQVGITPAKYFIKRLDLDVFGNLMALAERRKNFITGLYLKVFGRMPDEEGFAFWNGAMLEFGHLTMDQVEAYMIADRDRT